MRKLFFLLFALAFVISGYTKEYQVAKTRNNSNPRTSEQPFLAIKTAVDIAQSGDVITVHKGVCREWVKYFRRGISDTKRIVNRAAEGEKVETKDSEIDTGWGKLIVTVWQISIPNSFFGDYSPYKYLIHGTGLILGEEFIILVNYAKLKIVVGGGIAEDVLHPKTNHFDSNSSTYTWFYESNDENERSLNESCHSLCKLA